MGVPRKFRKLVAEMPLFRGLGAAEIDALWAVGSLRDIPQGAVLMEKGTLGMAAYLLLEGSVDVELPDGRTVKRGAGEVIGEMALLGLETQSNRRTATVTTAGPVRAMVLNRHYFEALMVDYPSLHERLVARIREREESRDR